MWGNVANRKEMAVAKSASILVGLVFCTVVCAAPLRAADDDRSGQWPSFRGEGARGIGQGNPPVKWDVTRSDNIKWQTPIEGLGHGGPVVWGNKVYLVTAANGTPQPVKTGVFGDIAPVENEKPFEWKLI